MRRLVLFDIDGTLVSGGPAKQAFHEALLEVFGTAGPILEWEFSGKTDPQIARELLTEARLTSDEIEVGLAHLWSRYLDGMRRRLPAEPLRPLPGVPELLAHLEHQSEIAVGLLTGNVIEGARLKLASAGVTHTFSVGAFGSDHEERNHLPEIAVRRASEHWGVSFDPGSVVVVGDTPRDVECGSHHGGRTVAVATGRFDLEALEQAGADVVLRDLSEVDVAMNALLA